MKEVRQEEDVKLTVAGLSIVLFSRSDVVGLFFPDWCDSGTYGEKKRRSAHLHWLGLPRIGAIVKIR